MFQMTQYEATADPGELDSTAKTPVDVDPTRWVDEHGDCLYRYALSRVRDEGTAEDIVQDTLLSALKALGSYTGIAAERTWLVGILKNKIADHFRKRSREVAFDPTETDLSEFDPMFERSDEWENHWHDTLSPRIWHRSPEDSLEQSEFFGVLQECLTKLPERVANAFTLREMNDIDAAEVCEILGLTQSNFWVMMHRARMSLRRCIEINWFVKA
jgi:RNA polymerase sigma-70 factor (ECF subfamily)